MAREAVFISYSHVDRAWLQALRTQLAPLIRQRALVVWDDTQIAPGTRWLPQIEQAIAGCKVAVLLVSPDFLASDFIQQRELPALLQAESAEGLRILWVHLRSCLYDETRIADFQCAHDPAQPLDALSAAEQGAALSRICRRIKEAASVPLFTEMAPVAAPPAAAAAGDLAHYVLVLSGRIDEADKPLVDALLSQLRGIARDTRLTLQRVEQGSIRLLLAGSEAGYRALFGAFIRGELAQALGRAVLAMARTDQPGAQPATARRALGYLDPRCIRLDVDLASKRQLFDYIGRLFLETAGLGRAAVVDNLHAREQLGSTGLGLGVAIPHARIPGLQDSLCALVRLRRPIAYDAPDGEPVGLLVVLLVSEAATAVELERLVSIAELLSDPRRRELLATSNDVERLHALVDGWLTDLRALPKSA